jgi:iron complex outermembrane receptor protein
MIVNAEVLHDTTKDPRSSIQQENVPITDVEVKADRSGSAEAGYRVDSIDVGPLGKKKHVETPYMINAVPTEMIQNAQVTTMADVMKFTPSAQMQARGGMTVGRPQTRGFQGEVTHNNRMDGMNIAITTAYPMEQFEQVDILNGLTGSIYGPAAPAGVFNFVLKRPTARPMYKITLGHVTYDPSDSANDHTYISADIGGPLGKNFGYRVNMLYDQGHLFVDNSRQKRSLTSLALDWKLLPHTVAEFNFSYYDYVLKGVPAGFGYGETIKLPSAMDPSKSGYGQQWAGHHLSTRTSSVRIKHEFNRDWNLTAGFLDQQAIRRMTTVSNTIINNDGDYKTSYNPSSAAGAWLVRSDILNLNGRVNIFGLKNDLLLGTNGHIKTGMSGYNTSKTVNLGTANIDNPLVYDEPSVWMSDSTYKGSVQKQQAVIVGDTITLGPVSVMLSGSYSWLRSASYNNNHEKTSKYEDEGLSPAASIMFKPFEKMMVYVSYSDSLQQGGTAPTTASNANENLPPYRSKQYESGLKLTLNKLDISTAVFRINRPFAYTDTDNVYGIKGEQVNYGAEVMVVGKIIDCITTYAGYTYLNPELTDTGVESTEGQQVVGVPKHQGNLYVEYLVPFIRGLAPSVNVHYTGKRAANAINTEWVEAYATLDIGIRYSAKMLGEKTTFRFTVNNVTDERYWASIFAGSTDGAANSSNTAFLGTPREFIASMEVMF